MTVMFWTYVIYFVICTGITSWVGGTLKRNGPTFVAHGKEFSVPVIESIIHLLIVGFYLIAFGAICFLLQFGERASSAETAIETLSVKVGSILVITGMLHFFVLSTFAKLRRTGDMN